MCQNKPCKDEGIKIEKGELRLGTWVEIGEHPSFKFRHWYVLFFDSRFFHLAYNELGLGACTHRDAELVARVQLLGEICATC
jgi:hypothetical protein